jgi:tRNA modification GTPase
VRFDEDTICAIATPIGEGGIGIVRVSGPDALAIANKMVRLRSARPLESVASHTLHLADIVFPGSAPQGSGSGCNDAIIDEGLVVYMSGARSFTAEDVVELQCHGSGIVLRRICEACLAAGARLAMPGEFTKRAFMNGRLDLSQAEAVLDTIRAKSDAGLRVAQRHLRGELSQHVDALRRRLLSMLAQVEAGIDFVEEDITFIGRTELVSSLQDALDQIKKMLVTAKVGRLLRDGARVVILGRPNVGKSSLLNAFLKEPRAIVTNIPGTTRDVLEEQVAWDGLLLTLVDTAGLRDSEDVVEQEGIRRTRAAEAEADLLIHVMDATELLGQAAVTPLREDPRQEILVVNKVDLIDASAAERLVETIVRVTGRETILISVRTGFGLERLKEKLVSRLLKGSAESTDGLIVSNVRHRSALERAAGALTEALTSTEGSAEPECVAVDLRDAAEALGEISGVITTDEVLGKIFSEFCIGK